MSEGMTRRDALKMSGLALGGLAVASVVGGCGDSSPDQPPPDPTNTNSIMNDLDPYYPGTETLGADEMRITFLGTSPIPRTAQECNSIFVEVGSGDQFVFDCGTGVVAKYNAMGIGNARMNKIFLTHIHADHMSDLCFIYCFGPATDRKSPLYIWGQTKSGVPDPVTGQIYEDGLKAYCERLREVCRWHTESFSFGATSYASYVPPTQADWGLPVAPVPVANDSPTDGYAMVPIELDWTKYGATPGDNVAYDNKTTGVKITHLPAIHTRKGSMSYRLEWNGMSMVFSGDTKPNYYMVDQAGGLDLFIHEMVVPADVWAMKNLGITSPDQVDESVWNAAYNYALAVQNSSHTPQGAFGYVLSQLNPPPRLAVATHFQATDDTIDSAMQSIREHYPNGDVTIAADYMVLNVTPDTITQRRAVVSEWAWYPRATLYPDTNVPKYHNADGSSAPTAQVDMSQAIPSTDPATGNVNYRDDGY